MRRMTAIPNDGSLVLGQMLYLCTHKSPILDTCFLTGVKCCCVLDYSQESNVVLSIATKVGLCISIICLLVTVVILFGVK